MYSKKHNSIVLLRLDEYLHSKVYNSTHCDNYVLHIDGKSIKFEFKIYYQTVLEKIITYHKDQDVIFWIKFEQDADLSWLIKSFGCKNKDCVHEINYVYIDSENTIIEFIDSFVQNYLNQI